MTVEGVQHIVGLRPSTLCWDSKTQCVWWELWHLLSHLPHGFLCSYPLATAVQTHWKPQLCSKSLPDRAGLYSCARWNNLNLILSGYMQGKALLGSLGRTTNRQWRLPQCWSALRSKTILRLEPDSGAGARAAPGQCKVVGPNPISGCMEECISDVPRHSGREEIACFLSFQGKTKTKKPTHVEGAFYSVCSLWNGFTFTWQHSCTSSAFL